VVGNSTTRKAFSMSGWIDSAANAGARFWESGHAFLWGCAGACVLVFGLLVSGSLLGFNAATVVLSEYGLFVLCGGLVFTSLAIARTWQSWPKKTLFLAPNEEQSIWGHARQSSGEVFTNFNIRLAVTNTSDSSVHLSKPRMVRPWRLWRYEAVTSNLVIQNATNGIYSQQYPVDAYSRSEASGMVVLRGAACNAGKRLSFVVSVMDHRGKRYRIKFKRVRASNTKPV
jgi:hypothetical protein